MGPTLVSYLRGVRVGAARTVAVATATAAVVAGATAAVVGVATIAAVAGGGAAAAVATVSRLGLDPLAGGGEEWRAHDLKLCPPRVLTMPGPEKGKR